MDHDYLWNTKHFTAAPMRPPRQGLIGENVFASEWAKLMADTENINNPPNEALSGVLGSYGYRLNQRSATVAASLVCWLGTNIGRCFLDNAAVMGKTTPLRGDAYLMAWAVENIRRSSTNHGRRALEACLISDATPTVVPKLSAADYEVAEHVVMWLGDEDGQRFLKACETEIKRQNQAESFRHHLTSNLKLEPSAVTCVLKMAAEYRPTPASPAAA